MKLWILVHERWHGANLFPTRTDKDGPPDIDPADRIAQGGSLYEPEAGENAEWFGPWEIEEIPLI
jgi:hypothetical protein